MRSMRISQLKGKTLDWAVELTLRALREEAVHSLENGDIVLLGSIPSYSSDWKFGGVLLENYWTEIWRRLEKEHGSRWPDLTGGPTLLLNAMRAFVSYHVGARIEIPESQL